MIVAPFPMQVFMPAGEGAILLILITNNGVVKSQRWVGASLLINTKEACRLLIQDNHSLQSLRRSTLI